MEKTLQEILDLLPILVDDMKTAEELLDKNDQEYYRRTFVRTLFAMIEGSVHAMKIALFAIGQSSGALNVPELVVCKESSFNLNERGKIKERAKRFRISENLRFTVNVIEHLLGAKIDLGVGTQDWNSFKKAIKIRNSVTHPKDSADLIISNADLKCIRSVNLWFNGIVVAMMDALRGYFKQKAITSPNSGETR